MNDVLSSRADDIDRPIELIGTADIPGGGELLLRQRGDDYAIEYGEVQLMVSWASRSERALASLACQRVTSPQPHILIGGLGMGFTLVAALADLPPAAKVVVAELVPPSWNGRKGRWRICLMARSAILAWLSASGMCLIGSPNPMNCSMRSCWMSIMVQTVSSARPMIGSIRWKGWPPLMRRCGPEECWRSGRAILIAALATTWRKRGSLAMRFECGQVKMVVVTGTLSGWPSARMGRRLFNPDLV